MSERYPRVRELLEIACRGLDIAEGRASLGRDVSHDERCVARTLREASILLLGERPAPEDIQDPATPSGAVSSSGPGPAANPEEPTS